jgi:hypothetical protein
MVAVADRPAIFCGQESHQLFSASRVGGEKLRVENFATRTRQKEDSMVYGQVSGWDPFRRILNGISRLKTMPHDLSGASLKASPKAIGDTIFPGNRP